MPQKSQRNPKITVDRDSMETSNGGIRLPKESKSVQSKVGHHWDKIFKRGERIRDAIGAMTPTVSGLTDRNRAHNLQNAFKKNKSVQ